jgi:hypothetical protein
MLSIADLRVSWPDTAKTTLTRMSATETTKLGATAAAR